MNLSGLSAAYDRCMSAVYPDQYAEAAEPIVNASPALVAVAQAAQELADVTADGSGSPVVDRFCEALAALAAGQEPSE